MGTAERVVRLGDRLRAMAQSLSLEVNESRLLAHDALARILRDDPELSRAHLDAYSLRTTLLAARWRERCLLESPPMGW